MVVLSTTKSAASDPNGSDAEATASYSANTNTAPSVGELRVILEHMSVMNGD